jgi:hypothetical protein
VICPVQFTRDLSGRRFGAEKLRVDKGAQYSAAEVERMMKLQDVLLKAMAKKISWGTAAEIIGSATGQCGDGMSVGKSTATTG